MVKEKVYIRYISGLISSFVIAIIFFAFFNHYLLDKSLANLKLSLRGLGKGSMEEAKKIKDILDDTYIIEMAKKDLEAVSLVELEFSSEIIKKAVERTQIEDAGTLLSNIIKKKEKTRPIIISKLEDLVLFFDRRHRKIDGVTIRKEIKEIEAALKQYKAERLQAGYLEIGRRYLLLKEQDKALAYFKKVVELKPQNLLTEKANLYIGFIYKKKGEYDKAIEVFSQSVKTKELIDFFTYQKGDSYYKMGKIEESIKIFEDMFEKEPLYEINQISQFRAGYIYRYDLEDEEKAYLAFEKLRRMAPGAWIVYDIENKIMPEMAEKYRQKAYNYLKQAYLFLEQERYEDAIKTFDKALDINPRDPLCYSGRGLAFCFLGREIESVKDASEARKFSIRDYRVLDNLGFIYYKVRALSKAVAEYKRAVKRAPKLYILNYNLGTVYLAKGELALASSYLKKAIKLAPDFAYAYNNLSYVLWYNKKYEEAKILLEKAIGLKPGFIEAHYNLGIILFTMGNYEEARKQFLQVKNLNPNYADTEYYLKEIKKKVGY